MLRTIVRLARRRLKTCWYRPLRRHALKRAFTCRCAPRAATISKLGLSKAFGDHVRFDANWFRRNVSNFEDDDLLLNTGVSFPIAFCRAKIQAHEMRNWKNRAGENFQDSLATRIQRESGNSLSLGGLFLDDSDADLLNATYSFRSRRSRSQIAVNGYVRY